VARIPRNRFDDAAIKAPPANTLDPEDLPVLTVTHQGVMRMLSVGASTAWKLLSEPDPDFPDPDDPTRPAIESISIGRRRLVLVESVYSYLERRRAAGHQRLTDRPPGQGRKLHRVNRDRVPVAPPPPPERTPIRRPTGRPRKYT
jgi:hypothetical protein